MFCICKILYNLVTNNQIGDNNITEMDPQFSLGSADNKGILSLLSAIEQTGDNFETDPDSPPPIKDDMSGHETEFNQLESLDIGLTLNKSVCLCLICGHSSSVLEPSDQVSMVDISMQISGIRIAEKIEDIVSRKIPEKHSTLICSDCFGVLQQIDLLELELLKFKRSITSKFSVSNPVKQMRVSPKKAGSSSMTVSGSTKSLRDVSLDYPESIIDTRMMPLQFLASDKEIERDIETLQTPESRSQGIGKMKSKLDILTETMMECHSSEEELTQFHSTNFNKSVTIFECEVCSRKFKNKSLYVKHVKSHTKARSHKCNECGKVFTSKSNLQAHLKLHYETRTFSCPHCAKEFKGKKSLMEHVSSRHNNEKKFPCSQCTESFSSRHLKNVHERLHNGEQGYICDQCGDSFATAQGLSHHKSKHTGDYQFVCKTCGKGFNNQKLLEEHEHIHTGSKPYECNRCDKAFGNRGSLWVHMKQHDNVKPYVCTECSKGFTHSSHLAVHKRIHSGEKPYRCRFCPEAFISSNHLKRHMKSHPNQLPFACGNCKQTFSLRRQLVSHSNKVHGGNVVEEFAGATNAAKAEAAQYTECEAGMEAEADNYSLMPVSIVDQSMLDTGLVGDTDQQRLVDLLGQDGVSLGQTIVLIQVIN